MRNSTASITTPSSASTARLTPRRSKPLISGSRGSSTPNDAELRTTFEMLEQSVESKLADSHARKAAMEERFGRWAAAAESWQRVVAARPDDAEARARLANALTRSEARSKG